MGGAERTRIPRAVDAYAPFVISAGLCESDFCALRCGRPTCELAFGVVETGAFVVNFQGWAAMASLPQAPNPKSDNGTYVPKLGPTIYPDPGFRLRSQSSGSRT